MMTIRINVIATILAGLVGAMFYVFLKNNGYTNGEMAMFAILTGIVIRTYDTVSGLPAFKERKNEHKNEKKDGGKNVSKT